MSTSTPTTATRTPMSRVAFASCTGTTIEFYDFFIYGTAAALVFPTVFFPALGDAAGTVASFATYAVAFFARPLGAVVFGHFGDRLGRKKTLIITLLLMGIATFLIGAIPSSAAIGVAAPIILVVLRIAQGLALGGEWAGSTLLAAEYAPKAKRGMYAIFPQLGPSIAFALSSLTFLIVNLFVGETSSAFVTWGWRIPFLLSAVLVLVGLYVRLKVEETPVFTGRQSEIRTNAATQAPIVEALRKQWREILLAGGSVAAVFAFFYIGSAFLTSYGTGVLGLSRGTVLAIGILAAAVFAASTIFSGIISDRVGRKSITLLSCAVGVGWAFVLFPIMDNGGAVGFAIGMSGSLAIMGLGYGPAGALLPELFRTQYRYTGAGAAYNLAGIIGGATAPILAVELTEAGNIAGIGWMLAGFAALSLVCTFFLPETRENELAVTEPAAA